MATSLPSVDTPIFKLTVGEFLELLSQHQPCPPVVDCSSPSSEKKYVYGIDGLARLIGCSRPTAHRMKSSGKIPYSQIGRKIVFDEQSVLAALQQSK